MSEGIGGPTVLRDDTQQVDGDPRFAAPPSGLRLSRKVRAKLEGVLRVLSMEELPGMNTREGLLWLNNRAIGTDYELTLDDITIIGNGSAMVSWQESQLRVCRKIISELLGDGTGSDPSPPSGAGDATGAQATEGTNP